MSIKLKFEGFDELLTKIEKAGGTIKVATDTCMRQAASTMERELKQSMESAKVDSGLINAMPPSEVEWKGNACIARVGYKKGTYDPSNPSDGYKVVFLNYGTPHRSKHGKIEKRGFIQRAKKKIKKQQEETLQKILEGVTK